MQTTIDIEYCFSCGHFKQFEELANKVSTELPNAEIKGSKGRSGSFEVKINDTLIHSKLQTLAFPEYDDVIVLAKEAESGESIKRQAKQQPITCVVS